MKTSWSLVKSGHTSVSILPLYVCVSGVWLVGPADWNKGAEGNGNKVLPKSAVSDHGYKESLQQDTY